MLPEKETVHFWSWFRDRVLPPVFAALAIGMITSGWATYQSIQSLTSRLERIETNYRDIDAIKIKILQIDNDNKEIQQLKSQIVAVEAKMVSKTDMLETLKRVELQLQLLLAQSGINKKIDLTSEKYR